MRSGQSDDDWDAALKRYGGHFLQTRAWQQVQERLGYEVVHNRGEQWLWAGSVRAGRFPRYVYVPYGPSGRDLDGALVSLKEAARSHALDFARIEPLSAPAPAALSRVRALSSKPVQPRWTWVLDLAPDEAELRRGLSAGHRGSINAAPRRGLTIRRSNDPAEVEIFNGLQRTAADRTAYRPQQAGYYRALVDVLVPARAGALYLAEAEGAAVAAAIVFYFAATRYYAHAVSDPGLGRKLGAAAPLVWQMILDARADGATSFDFWGVSPPRARDHAWTGFSQFKRSFGGRLVERPGAWEIPVRRARHRVFSMARSLKR